MNNEATRNGSVMSMSNCVMNVKLQTINHSESKCRQRKTKNAACTMAAKSDFPDTTLCRKFMFDFFLTQTLSEGF